MYVRIMPPYIPWPAAMVAVSGLFEILGGVGFTDSEDTPRRRMGPGRAAGRSVFPANLYMATDPVEAERGIDRSVATLGPPSVAGVARRVGAVVHEIQVHITSREERVKLINEE